MMFSVTVAAAIHPRSPWMDMADPPRVRASKLVAQMTTDEKLNLHHGSCGGYTGNVCANPRLGIPALKMNDGPQGFRGAPSTSTAFPAAVTVAATWSTELAQQWGEGMGDEFYRKGANVQLGPGLCVARVPRNGRNFEYVSGEDPFLGYHLGGAVVRGIQSQGVVANAKHCEMRGIRSHTFVSHTRYAAPQPCVHRLSRAESNLPPMAGVVNNQETDRHFISENVDERTMFEIYYPPFEGAIVAGLGSVMCSYNLIGQDLPAGSVGNWSCENDATLRRDLKGRLGFDGWVMSDWGATHSTSLARGLDQEMPGASYMSNGRISALMDAGEISPEMLDNSSWRVLWPLFAVGAFDTPNNNTAAADVRTPNHTALARRLAARGTVLLKNQGLLPVSLSAGVQRIAVIGSQAAAPTIAGGGSGAVSTSFVSTPLERGAARARQQQWGRRGHHVQRRARLRQRDRHGGGGRRGTRLCRDVESRGRRPRRPASRLTG